MTDPVGLRNLENLVEDDDERGMPPGVTLTLVVLGGACIVFAAFALGGRSSVPQAGKSDPLGDLVSRRSSLPAAAASARTMVDLVPRDVTFPQMLSDDDRPSTALAAVPFGESADPYDEHWLQRLVHDHPDCLPVEEIEPGFGQPIPVCMELPTKHGPVDNLLITPDGDLVIVEVKLWRNPESRRKVVAQALDYASCLFEMDYAELEQAVLKADFGDGSRPERLHDLFSGADAKDEASFVDAMNQNLRRGRALILVVGDGIRTEAARLASLVQSHGGAHFTFAMVELGVFSLPDSAGLIVCPRTLVQTEMISRAIVRIEDKRTLVVADERTTIAAATTAAKPLAESMSSEQFYEAMAKIDPRLPDQLRAFITRVEPLGVYADFRKSLIFRWDPPEGKSINLGYIMRQGQVWTEGANAAKEERHLYNEELAAAFGVEVERQSMGDNWYLKSNGRVLRIDQVSDRLDQWPAIIEHFMGRVRARLAREQ